MPSEGKGGALPRTAKWMMYGDGLRAVLGFIMVESVSFSVRNAYE
jgi:hypothetical protein